MMTWLKRRGRTESRGDLLGTRTARPQTVGVPREYLSLYKYLNERFADIVVLTFAEIEDLIGSTLPDAARVQPEWWANEGPDHTPSAQARAWTQARRTAEPHLLAQTVWFERALA